jgi:hypothetical protein
MGAVVKIYLDQHGEPMLAAPGGGTPAGATAITLSRITPGPQTLPDGSLWDVVAGAIRGEITTGVPDQDWSSRRKGGDA